MADHFVLSCKCYLHACYSFRRELKKLLSLTILLGDPDDTTLPLNCVTAAGRFPIYNVDTLQLFYLYHFSL